MLGRIGQGHHRFGNEPGHRHAGLRECRLQSIDVLVRPSPELDRIESGAMGRPHAIGEIAGLGEQPFDAG